MAYDEAHKEPMVSDLLTFGNLDGTRVGNQWQESQEVEQAYIYSGKIGEDQQEKCTKMV